MGNRLRSFGIQSIHFFLTRLASCSVCFLPLPPGIFRREIPRSAVGRARRAGAGRRESCSGDAGQADQRPGGRCHGDAGQAGREAGAGRRVRCQVSCQASPGSGRFPPRLGRDSRQRRCREPQSFCLLSHLGVECKIFFSPLSSWVSFRVSWVRCKRFPLFLPLSFSSQDCPPTLQADLSRPETIPATLVGIHTVIDCATGRPEEPIKTVIPQSSSFSRTAFLFSSSRRINSCFSIFCFTAPIP